MTPTRIDIVLTLTGQLDENVENRNRWWREYWEGRRMVTVPDPSVKEGDAHHVVSEHERGCSGPADLTRPGDEPGRRLFASFPNLAPKPTPQDATDLYVTNGAVITVIRACIARLKAARDKDSTNRNLSTLLVVVVKVQKDLETLVGDDWQKTDAAGESQVTRDDRSL